MDFAQKIFVKLIYLISRVFWTGLFKLSGLLWRPNSAVSLNYNFLFRILNLCIFVYICIILILGDRIREHAELVVQCELGSPSDGRG